MSSSRPRQERRVSVCFHPEEFKAVDASRRRLGYHTESISDCVRRLCLTALERRQTVPATSDGLTDSRSSDGGGE